MTAGGSVVSLQIVRISPVRGPFQPAPEVVNGAARIIESGHASWLNTVIPSWPPCACILNSVVMACCIRANCLGEKENLLQLQQVGLGVAGRKSIGVICTVTVS